MIDASDISITDAIMTFRSRKNRQRVVYRVNGLSQV